MSRVFVSDSLPGAKVGGASKSNAMSRADWEALFRIGIGSGLIVILGYRYRKSR